MSKTLITGGSGQVGKCLLDEAHPDIQVLAPNSSDFNLATPEALRERLEELSPAQIINCAAYTNVDGAESDPDTAHVVNAESPAVMAKYAAEKQIPFIHISTDFVFDGRKSTPYQPEDTTNPLNIYGASKLAGEKSVRLNNPDAYIVRTSWVYSEYGDNFVLKMIDLAANRDSLAVVADQIGSPCYARNLARVLWKLVKTCPDTKLFHYADDGSISRYELVTAAINEALSLGLISRPIELSKARTEDFPSPAIRPAYSTMDSSLICQNLSIEPVEWRPALHEMVTRALAQRQTASA